MLLHYKKWSIIHEWIKLKTTLEGFNFSVRPQDYEKLLEISFFIVGSWKTFHVSLNPMETIATLKSRILELGIIDSRTHRMKFINTKRQIFSDETKIRDCYNQWHSSEVRGNVFQGMLDFLTKLFTKSVRDERLEVSSHESSCTEKNIFWVFYMFILIQLLQIEILIFDIRMP